MAQTSHQRVLTAKRGFFAPNPLNREPIDYHLTDTPRIGKLEKEERTVLYCPGWGWYAVEHVRFVPKIQMPLSDIEYFGMDTHCESYLQYFSIKSYSVCPQCDCPHEQWFSSDKKKTLCSNESWLKDTVGVENPALFMKMLEKFYNF